MRHISHKLKRLITSYHTLMGFPLHSLAKSEYKHENNISEIFLID